MQPAAAAAQPPTLGSIGSLRCKQGCQQRLHALAVLRQRHISTVQLQRMQLRQ